MTQSLPRRDVLRLGAASGAALLVPATVTAGGAAPALAAKGTPAKTAFRHGVASGDPLPDGVLLWTRVTPTADAVPGSGAGPAVTVRWEVALDAALGDDLPEAGVGTGPARDHTVKVAVSGLAPATDYWFRFSLGGSRSKVGRTRTAPGDADQPGNLRLGVVSCANYQAGYFSAYRHLADRGDLDAVLHLGDYLYEYAPGEYQARDVVVRPHDPAREMTTLSDYRRRHAQYKSDPDLQALHAAAPWIVTWDDHESANDAWRDGAENHTEGAEGTWEARRAAALQAYAEWMPIRMTPGEPIYRRLRFGRLAELSMLDLRSYRSQQVVNSDLGSIDDPDRSITGDAQMAWLKAGLVTDAAQWKLVGNPVMIAPVVFPPLPAEVSGPVADVTGLIPPDGVPYNTDQWDGYTADRRELFAHLADNGVQDTVFLTGDIHSTWACDLPLDAGTYPASRTVGVELVGTSVTSDNLDDVLRVPPRTASVAVEEGIKANNRHVRHLEFDSHGFSVLDITPERVQMDWYYLADRMSKTSAAVLATSYRVGAGTQRVVPAPAAIQ